MVAGGHGVCMLGVWGEARSMVEAGCGVSLYSEGMYEDVNKVVWARVLWDAGREAKSIVEEYSRYYFGASNQAAARLGPSRCRISQNS